MKQKQTRLFPNYPPDIPNIENYPLPKIARGRRVVSIIFSGEPVSASVGFSGNKAYRSVDYTAYRDALAWLIKEKLGGEWDIHRYSFGIRVRFFLSGRRKIDIDNLLKPVMDAATHIVWADDSQVEEVYSVMLRNQDEPGIEFLIYTIDDFVDYKYHCGFCGKELHPKVGGGEKLLAKKFCSLNCHNNSQRKGEAVICKECGKSFWNGRNNGQRQVAKTFCSRVCYYSWMKKNGKEAIQHITGHHPG